MTNLSRKQVGKSRYYSTPIGELPSSTTILSLLNKPALMYWSVKVAIQYLGERLNDIRDGRLELTADNAYKILQEAKQYHEQIKTERAGIGTRVHRLIETYIKSQPYQHLLDDQTKTAFQAFLDWENKYQFSLVRSEQSVWSKRGYAGTLDCACYLTPPKSKTSKLYVVDFKTSKSIYREHILQLASYKYAYEENTKEVVRGVGILRLDGSTGLPDWKDIPLRQISKAYKEFLCLTKLWHLQHSGI